MRRLIPCLYLLAVLSFASQAFASDMYSNHTQGLYDGCDNDDQCCLKFTFVATQAPETVTFKLLSDLGTDPDNCFDWDCLNSGPLNPSYDPVTNEITFTVNSNGTYTLWLCPEPGQEACAMQFGAFQWESVGQNPNSEYGEGGLYWNCLGQYHCGLTCDIVKVYNNGTNIVICVTRNQSSATGSVKVYFDPPLENPCNFNGGGALGNYDPPFFSWPSQWTIPSPSWKDSLIFVPDGGGSTPALGPCQTECFSIPICGDVPGEPSPVDREIRIVTDGTDSCSNQTFRRTFKIRADGVYLPDGTRAPDLEPSLPNYPNPLTSANEFKTMIPFTAPADGEALISIVSEAGQEILRESMEVTKGKHFFFFTGETLPQGRYFYTIQSPRGRVIVQRSLLIVK